MPLQPGLWSGGAYSLYLLLVVLAAYRAPWDRVHGEMLHVFLGACVALMLLWTLRAGVSPGLGYHYLGTTVLVLMFGWSLAVVGVAGVAVGVALAGAGDGLSLAWMSLLDGIVPATVAYGVYRLVDATLPRHLFIYIFLCAFLGAGVAIAASTVTTAGLLTLSGSYSLEQVRYEYLRYLPLMVFPEAWLSGTVMMALVALRPQWVTTFDDAQYLHGK